MAAPSTTTKPWRLVELDDGSQWVTDGHDVGFAPDAVPAALKALEDLRRKVAAHTDRTTVDTFRAELDAARVAIARSEGRL